MKIRISTAAAIALFVIAPLTVTRAQAASTQCADGTTSTAVGKGACSGHGGVKSAQAPGKTKSPTKAAPQKASADAKADAAKAKGETKSTAAKTKPDTKAAPTKSKTTPTKAKPDTKAAPTKAKPPVADKASDKDAKDATALCKDGTYSHAATHTGACSGHGGVDKFLK